MFYRTLNIGLFLCLKSVVACCWPNNTATCVGEVCVGGCGCGCVCMHVGEGRTQESLEAQDWLILCFWSMCYSIFAKLQLSSLLLRWFGLSDSLLGLPATLVIICELMWKGRCVPLGSSQSVEALEVVI